MTATTTAPDPERATLDKAASENFPVAPFFLPATGATTSWRSTASPVW